MPYEVISEDVTLRVVEPHIYSVDSHGENTNSYDKKFRAFYDRVACNRFYNRLVWGYRPAEFHSFCLNALKSSRKGWVLDLGCGSLAFTAHTYVNYTKRPVVFLDQSIKQLQLAKSRIIRLKGNVPANLVFIHGDALRLPFKPQSFKTIISLNLLHVVKDIKELLLRLITITANERTISLTTLVENNRLADKYLHMWGKAGELLPRSANLLFSVFDELGISVKYRIKGNMAFINYR